MSTGRNDPCPCAKGRKFKHCHGVVADPGARASAVASTGPQPLAAAKRRHEAGGDATGAEALYRQVIEGEPGNAAALSGLGTLLFRCDRIAEAEDTFRSLVDLAPGDAGGHCNRSALRRCALQPRASPLLDVERFTRDVEAALRSIAARGR